MTLNKFSSAIIAFFSGALLTAAFAPFNVFPFAILAPAILLGFWLNSSPKRSFWLGWLFGLGFFGTGVYWVFISVHTFGNAPAIMAALVTGLMIAYLALFPALTGFLLNRYFPLLNSTKIIFAFPALWVLLEWVRSWAFSGFPWLLIGNSQLNSPLKGYAPILGVYGVSLAVVLSSALLILALSKYKQSRFKGMLLSLITLALIWVLGAYLSTVTWTKPYGEKVKVSLVQGNIPQDVKWTPEHIQPTLEQYLTLTSEHWDSKIIIWPESAIPLPKQHAQKFLDEVAGKAKQEKVTFITGIPIQVPNSQSYYNAVIALGAGEGEYYKKQLVPFGEYIPMRDTLGRLLDLLNVPMSDFISGESKPKPILANGIKIATFICYEIAYPEQVLRRDGDIDIILTVSNDAWFGHSIAQAQHLEIAKMRALEMGRPILFGSNDGITAIINAQGKVQSSVPQYQTVVLTDEVQPTKGKTPWHYLGMDPILGILIAFIAIAYFRRKKP